MAAKTVLVHKVNEEGALVLDAITGRITTPLDERPEWSDGLAVAMFNERDQFYSSRLGDKYTAEHKHPEMIAYQDLTWLGAGENEGEAVEIEADADYRMEVVSEILGIDREGELEDLGTLGATDASGYTVTGTVDVDTLQHMTQDEHGLYRKVAEEGFAEQRRTA